MGGGVRLGYRDREVTGGQPADEIAGIVTRQLNQVPGIVGTETHIAFRAYSAHDLEAAFSLGG